MSRLKGRYLRRRIKDTSEARTRDLEARIAQLEARLAASQPRWEEITSTGPRKVSRRALVKLGLASGAGAIAAATAGSLASTTAFAATNTADHYTAFGADSSYTPNPGIGFDASDPNAGFSSGVSAFGSATGVQGSSTGKWGAGVEGIHFSKQFPGYGVAGATVIGTGVIGESLDHGTGVSGVSVKGIGVHARSGGNTHAAIYGENSEGGIGVHGKSHLGRGGVFSGVIASLQLVPTRAKSHPRNGQPGDLIVDAVHRLWYCHQGGSPAGWKQIA